MLGHVGDNPEAALGVLKVLVLRVLITSRGAETIRDALAPAMEATKFWLQEALL